MAFRLLPLLDAWIAAVWSLISILVVGVAMPPNESHRPGSEYDLVTDINSKSNMHHREGFKEVGNTIVCLMGSSNTLGHADMPFLVTTCVHLDPTQQWTEPWRTEMGGLTTGAQLLKERSSRLTLVSENWRILQDCGGVEDANVQREDDNGTSLQMGEKKWHPPQRGSGAILGSDSVCPRGFLRLYCISHPQLA